MATDRVFAAGTRPTLRAAVSAAPSGAGPASRTRLERHGQSLRAGSLEGVGDVRAHRLEAGAGQDDVPGEGVPAVRPPDHAVAALDGEAGDPGAGAAGADGELGRQPGGDPAVAAAVQDRNGLV